ncbi:MAG TPA: hypothetical protein VIH42_14825 [Thermoguttaceae bacterium]
MFEQLIMIGELLINGLSKLKLTRNKRKLIAKHLGSLYRDLTQLLENGKNILRLFRRHNNGKDIDIDELRSLLEEQHLLIPRITSNLRRKDIKSILSIRVPQITPLQVLLFAKGSRVKFYLNKFDKAEEQRADSSNIRWIRPNTRLDLPKNYSIDKSNKQLKKIKVLVEELRRFIIDNFEVHEII